MGSQACPRCHNRLRGSPKGGVSAPSALRNVQERDRMGGNPHQWVEQARLGQSPFITGFFVDHPSRTPRPGRVRGRRCREKGDELGACFPRGRPRALARRDVLLSGSQHLRRSNQAGQPMLNFEAQTQRLCGELFDHCSKRLLAVETLALGEEERRRLSGGRSGSLSDSHRISRPN